MLDDGRQTTGQLLAKFNAPLVEGIDVPDRRLHEYLVFIERHQPSQRARVEAAIEEHAGRAVARENFMRREALDIGFATALLPQQRLGLIQRAPVHEGFALRQAIREQQRVVMRIGFNRLRRD